MVATSREKIAGLSLDTTGHGKDDSHPVDAHAPPTLPMREGTVIISRAIPLRMTTIMFLRFMRSQYTVIPIFLLTPPLANYDTNVNSSQKGQRCLSPQKATRDSHLREISSSRIFR
jgi:hypothetical protein